jgi:DNA-binding MarR family transcriptional regulator
MVDPIIREISGCTCLRARRTTRHLTQIYDCALEPVGLTINQFGVLACLYGSSLEGQDHISIGALADLIGKHPTTLNRDLRLLVAQGLVADAPGPVDRRVRALLITGRGRTKLRKAVTFWRLADTQLREALGVKAVLALNTLLDLALAKLAK